MYSDNHWKRTFVACTGLVRIEAMWCRYYGDVNLKRNII